MSCRIRAKIIPCQFFNSDCVKMALEECPCPAGLTLQSRENKFIVDYIDDNRAHQKFLENFPRIYNQKADEMLERLRREQADLKENSALAAFSEEDRRRKEIKIKREIKRLEKERKAEQEEHKKEIESKVEIMVQRAKTAGFVPKKELINGKVRIQLVRRL
ncbi:hypothetical protein JCM10550A_17030 [Methanogenium cariaci]